MLSIVEEVLISYCLEWCSWRQDNQPIYSIPSSSGMNGGFHIGLCNTYTHVPAWGTIHLSLIRIALLYDTGLTVFNRILRTIEQNYLMWSIRKTYSLSNPPKWCGTGSLWFLWSKKGLWLWVIINASQHCRVHCWRQKRWRRQGIHVRASTKGEPWNENFKHNIMTAIPKIRVFV